MQQKTGSFHTSYTDKNKQVFDIPARYFVFKKGAYDAYPHDDILVCSFWVIEATNGFSNFPKSFVVYLLEDNGEWKIGRLINQRFEIVETDFLNQFKTIVVDQYNSNTNAQEDFPNELG